MALRSLPDHPDLDQLELQAQELQRAHGAGQLPAAARIAGHHPALSGSALPEILAAPFSLADAQLVIAREHGFSSWAKLRLHVDAAARWSRLTPYPGFEEALAALDAGELERLRALLRADPALVHARGQLQPPVGYFTGAMLLHHVAGNPGRTPLPPNIVELARLLIDAGADVNAETIAPRGGATTMGLIITSAHCSEVGATGPLMELLLAHGANLDLQSPDALAPPIANHAPRAAEKMLELGARMDVLAAAALGRMEALRGFFDGEGRLKDRPYREGALLSERDAIGLAFLHAYVNKRPEAVEFLLAKDGNWNMVGVNNGTALHRAAGGGDLAMVQRLVAKGADLDDRNNPFCATPISWADHVGDKEIFGWMSAHCPVDLHDAVCFDLPEHVRARLAEAPRSVDRQLDQWDVPRSTALHWAAWCQRPHLARLLLDAGANPNLLAGDGRTPLDAAQRKGAAEVAELIRQRGGVPASAL